VDDQILHRIDDDLRDGALEEWIAGVVSDVEGYLAKHAAFDTFLDEQESPAS
jgi:hypothetical protein